MSFRCDHCWKETDSLLNENMYDVSLSAQSSLQESVDLDLCSDCFRQLREMVTFFRDDVNMDASFGRPYIVSVLDRLEYKWMSIMRLNTEEQEKDGKERLYTGLDIRDILMTLYYSFGLQLPEDRN